MRQQRGRGEPDQQRPVEWRAVVRPPSIGGSRSDRGLDRVQLRGRIYCGDPAREGDEPQHDHRGPNERQPPHHSPRFSRPHHRPRALRHVPCEVADGDRGKAWRVLGVLAAEGLDEPRAGPHDRNHRDSRRQHGRERPDPDRWDRLRGGSRYLGRRVEHGWRDRVAARQPETSTLEPHLGPLDLRLEPAWKWIVSTPRARHRWGGEPAGDRERSSVPRRFRGLRLNHVAGGLAEDFVRSVIRRPDRKPKATMAAPKTVVPAPIQIQVGLFDMKEPRIRPRPWKVQTIPANRIRTPNTMTIRRMERQTLREPFKLCPRAGGVSRPSSRGLRGRASSGTTLRSRRAGRDTTGSAAGSGRRSGSRGWSRPGSRRRYRARALSSRGRRGPPPGL